MSRIVLLTGATRGCGRALTNRFVAAGCIVWGCGRSVDQVKHLQKQFPEPHRFDVVDVADDAQVAQWAARLKTASRVPCDLLINNAAVMNETMPIWEISASEFDNLMRVNVCGVANVVRHFVPWMIEQRQGVIVNFSSGWGRTTAPHVAPYCASKFAIEGLTRSLGQELPSGMAAIPLNPGIINTEMLQSCWAEDAENYPAPEAWSRVAAPFLLSLGVSHNGKSVDVPAII